MKIVKVVATDLQTNEKQYFTFGTSSDGKKLVTKRGGRLSNYFDYCFEQAECARDVEIEFCVNDETYSLNRLHNEDGTTRTVLKKKVDGIYQVVARTHAVEYIEALVGTSVSGLLRVGYVNNKAVECFHGDLLQFDEIRLLSDVQQSIERSNAEAQELKANAMHRLKKYVADAVPASADDLSAVNAELDTLVRDITVATAQLGELKAKQNVDTIRADIAAKLNETQNKYNKLIARQPDVEEARAKVKLHDDVELLIPKVKTLQSVTEQRDSYEKRRYEITGELEWHEKELANIRQQLEEKNKQYALTQDKRTRIEAINNELTYIASLYEKNKKLNEQLLELNDKRERLIAEKALYQERLGTVEKTLDEVKESLDAFNIPARSVGELLEAVRIDVKIDEVNAQLEKLSGELAVKESQIAEKESNLVVQVKRFRAVADIDNTVTPFKARETILQVLDTKYSKLDTINLSLKEKQRNLDRALEDYKYRLIQLEQSKSKLEADLEKTLLRKQEEFKREVYLNSQKVFSDDATGIFAATVSFNDKEVETLKQEIGARSMDRDLIIERISQLEGSLKEIARHIEINAVEMETLQREKDNINRRYNEIVSQNTNEAVFNYLKALSSNNGTKYLLDVQQDAVRNEAELGEFKRTAESLRVKIAALKSRLNYLQETQSGFDDTRTSIDNLIATNDKIKDELSDIGVRLSSGYEQYKALTRQLENIESRLDDINGAIIENTKTVKVNEQQIAESTLKAQGYAGTDDLEQAVTNFRYELGDVESERQMLLDSVQNTEKDIFRKRLELEKTQWLYESKQKEYDELHNELEIEFKLKGLDVDKVVAMDLESGVEGLRKIIAEFDTMRSQLSEKIDNLSSILQSSPAPEVSVEEIEAKQQEIDLLTARQAQLEEQRNKQLSTYVAASTARAKVGVAAAEAKTLNNLKVTIGHNEIVSLLIADKVKSILLVATQFLNGYTGGNGRLIEQQYKLQLKEGNTVTEYDELPVETKTAVYVALMLALPSAMHSDGKWLIFEERLNANREALSGMVANSSDICYVIGQRVVKDKKPSVGENASPIAAASASTSESVEPAASDVARLEVAPMPGDGLSIAEELAFDQKTISDESTDPDAPTSASDPTPDYSAPKEQAVPSEVTLSEQTSPCEQTVPEETYSAEEQADKQANTVSDLSDEDKSPSVDEELPA